MSEDPELDEIRRRKQAEIQQQYQKQEQQEEAKSQIENQKQRILLTILTEEARIRLNNIKMANEEFATSLENQLIQLSQSGRIRAKITDDQLKTMLRQLQGSKKKDSSIKIKRK